MCLVRQWSRATVPNAWTFTHRRARDIIIPTEHISGRDFRICCLWFTPSTDRSVRKINLYLGKYCTLPVDAVRDDEIKEPENNREWNTNNNYSSKKWSRIPRYQIFSYTNAIPKYHNTKMLSFYVFILEIFKSYLIPVERDIESWVISIFNQSFVTEYKHDKHQTAFDIKYEAQRYFWHN